MRLILAPFLLLLALPVWANDWEVARQPGVSAIMRHALAPGTGDPARFALGDCSTQRNLDERGRAQARALGDAFRARGIVFDTVLASQWCRTTETAELLNMGAVVPAAPLNSFFGDRSTAAVQTEAARALIENAQGRLMLVTHQVNITALTGVVPQSGEVLLIETTDEGITVVGSILIRP